MVRAVRMYRETPLQTERETLQRKEFTPTATPTVLWSFSSHLAPGSPSSSTRPYFPVLPRLYSNISTPTTRLSEGTYTPGTPDQEGPLSQYKGRPRLTSDHPLRGRSLFPHLFRVLCRVRQEFSIRKERLLEI